MSITDDVLTLQDVANLLKVHPNTVYRLARKGAIPAFKIGTDWRFQRSSIEEWMSARRSVESASVADDVFHVTFWLLAQGISLTVTAAEIAGVLEISPRAVERELKALVRLGHVSECGARRFALTAEGLEEARRRFLQKRPLPSGHASVVAFASQASRG